MPVWSLNLATTESGKYSPHITTFTSPLEAANAFLTNIGATPAKAATYTYVNPIIALIVGAWLGDEVMSNWTLACSAVIILGVVVTITAKMQAK